jgi:hypothetical protein
MKMLNSLKIPVMVMMTVGGVWLAGWQARFSDPHRKEILPPTAIAQRLAEKARADNPADQAALFRDEYLR